MTLTDNEQRIARLVAVLAIVIVVGGGWYWWSGKRDELTSRYNTLKASVDKNNATIEKGKKDYASFSERFRDQPGSNKQVAIVGMPQLDPKDYKTEPQKLDVTGPVKKMADALSNKGLAFTAFNITQPTRASGTGSDDFRIAHFTAVSTTNTARLAGFLQYVENARMPLRLEQLNITTPVPGQDSLDVTFVFSVLIYSPPSEAAKVKLSGKGGATTGGTTATKPGTTGAGRGTTPTVSPSGTLSAEEQKATEDRLAAERIADMAKADQWVKEHPPKTPAQLEAERQALELQKAADEERRRQEAAKVEEELLRRRQEQEQKLSTQPAAPTPPAGGQPGNDLNPGGAQ